jgi:hypothetical protein
MYVYFNTHPAFIWIPAVFLLSPICSCIDKKQAMQGLSIEHLSIYYVYE